MWCSFDIGNKKKREKESDGERRKMRERLQVVEGLEGSIDLCVEEMFTSSSKSLLEFLSHNRNTSLNDSIPTAIVCCSFAHVGILRDSLRAGLDTNILNIGRDSSCVRTVIDDARNAKGNSVLLVEQLESLDAEFIERLIYLMKWFEVGYPLVICLSTDISSFSSLCSLSTLKSLNTEVFEMPAPPAIYDRIVYCLVSKGIQERIYLSGDCLSLFRTRFFGTGFCADQLKRTLRLCVQENYWDLLDQDTSDMEEFDNSVAEYWENLKFYCSHAGISTYKLHETVQTGRNWRNKILPFDLALINDWLSFPSVSEEARLKMQEALSAFEAAVEEKKTKPVTATQVAPPKSGTLAEHKRMMEAQRNASLKEKQSSPELLLKEAFATMVVSLLCPWSTFPGHQKYLIGAKPSALLFCDPAEVVENALLAEENKLEPLAVSYSTLQLRPNWKSHKLEDWLKSYERQVIGHDSVASFFASIGHLESMGVVKASGERNKGSVAILHHPVNHVAN